MNSPQSVNNVLEALYLQNTTPGGRKKTKKDVYKFLREAVFDGKFPSDWTIVDVNTFATLWHPNHKEYSHYLTVTVITNTRSYV